MAQNIFLINMKQDRKFTGATPLVNFSAVRSRATHNKSGSYAGRHLIALLQLYLSECGTICEVLGLYEVATALISMGVRRSCSTQYHSSSTFHPLTQTPANRIPVRIEKMEETTIKARYLVMGRVDDLLGRLFPGQWSLVVPSRAMNYERKLGSLSSRPLAKQP